MNILIISNNLKGWTYETLYYEQQLLNKFGKFKYFFWGPGYNFDTNDFLEYEKVLKKKKISIDLIFICLSQQELINKFDYKKYPKTFKIKHKFKKFPLNLDKSKIPKVLLMVDFWVLNKFQWEDILRRYDISSIISSYLFFSVDGKINKEFTTEYTNCLKKFHYMRTIKEIKYFEKKKINIISLGQKENKFYPFRKKFDEVIKKNFQKKNYLIQSHPGYNYSKSKKIFKGDKYLKLLSKSKIMISDTTQLNIVMIKHIECLYNRCVMFCNSILKPNLYDLKNKINFVHVNEKNLSYKLKYYLDNPSKLNKISKNGYNLYKKKYSNKIYVKRMEDYFVKISKSHVFKYSKNYNFIIFFKLKTLSLYSELIRFLKKILFKLRLKKKYQL